MKLEYIQRKSAVSSLLWLWGCGLGMTYYPIKKVYAGFDMGDTIWFFRREEGFLCGDRNTHLGKLVDNFQKYIVAHPRHAATVKRIYERRQKKFQPFIAHLADCDYAQASDHQLWLDYQGIIKCYAEVYPYGEPFAIALGDLYDKISGRFLKSGLSGEQLEKLILPPSISFVQKERLGLLKIARENRGRKISAASAQKLARHQLAYAWLPFDYGVKSYSLKHFRRELEIILAKDRAAISKEYRKLRAYERNLRREQKAIVNKFKITRRQSADLKIFQTAFYLVDSKKEFFTRLHWFAQRLFKEIGRRADLPLKLAQYMLPAETEKFLRDKRKPNRRLLRARYDHCAFRIKNDGRIIIYSPRRAKKIIDSFMKESARRPAASETIVKGRTANRGWAKGRARVILDARQCENFKHGEILVTAMTSPDYMLAARKAAAIVTDEGGVICHAAIISRELNIPCIVGAKQATRMLRDGDFVEVDANQGIVKIIKR